MEFFELGIERIHKLIFDCFSLAFQRGLLFGIIALLLGIILVLLSHKYALFKRESSVLRVIAYTYNFYIPTILCIGGFALGASLATGDFFAKETKTSISPLMKLVFPTYQSHVNIHWARVIQTKMTFTQTVDEYVQEIKFTPRDASLNEGVATYVANMMVPKITRWGVESVVSSARDIALKQSEEQGYVETSKVKALLIVHTMSMFNYPPGLWEESNKRLEDKLTYFFLGIAGNIALVLLLLLTIPFIEVLLYRVVSHKKYSYSGAHASNPNRVQESKKYDVLEEVEKSTSEKIPPTLVDIEIPKVYEN